MLMRLPAQQTQQQAKATLRERKDYAVLQLKK
jgi:hypothetical protein